MSKCLNPDCLAVNSSIDKFCTKCGKKLLLKERYRGLKIIGEGGFGRTFLAIDEDKPSKPNCVIKQFLPQAQGTNNLEKAAELFAQEAERLDDLGKHEQIPELLAYFSQAFVLLSLSPLPRNKFLAKSLSHLKMTNFLIQ